MRAQKLGWNNIRITRWAFTQGGCNYFSPCGKRIEKCTNCWNEIRIACLAGYCAMHRHMRSAKPKLPAMARRFSSLICLFFEGHRCWRCPTLRKLCTPMLSWFLAVAASQLVGGTATCAPSLRVGHRVFECSPWCQVQPRLQV